MHATGQVASVDMPVRWTPDKLHHALNALLDDDLWVEAVEVADPDFHPRFDAEARTYHYDVGTRPEASSPFRRRSCWPLGEDLDRRLLDTSAAMLIGEHSFKAFAKAGQPERGDRCHVVEAAWSPSPTGVRLTITADRFLHHMVRYLVGTMVEIAMGRRPLEDMARLLGNDPELTTSPPAPPQGLVLTHVAYPRKNDPSPTPSPSERSNVSA